MSIGSPSSSNVELPPEVRGIIYDFLESKQLAHLYFTTSKATTGEIDGQGSLIHRIEVVKASRIVDSEGRAKRLKELAEIQIQRNINGAVATAATVQVPYLKIRLLCELGRAFAASGNSDAAKTMFAQARKETEDTKSRALMVYLFIEIGKADPFEADISFSKAEEAMEGEELSYRKAQYKRLIDRARVVALKGL